MQSLDEKGKLPFLRQSGISRLISWEKTDLVLCGSNGKDLNFVN